jgi:hypothetical protein
VGDESKLFDEVIARGDRILLASPVAEAKGFFAKELDYLYSKGFTLSSDGTQMFPPRL